MSDSGIAIDAHSETVLLIGVDVIHTLLGSIGTNLKLEHFNQLAAALLKQYGPTYGVDLDEVNYDDWRLGATTLEDSRVLNSYLADPRMEVAFSLTEHDLIPGQEKKKCLH